MSTEPARSARHASGQAGPSGARGQPAGLRVERPLFPGSGRARFSVRSCGGRETPSLRPRALGASACPRESEPGRAAWLPHPCEGGRGHGFPPLALQARNCNTKPVSTPAAPPAPAQPRDPPGTRGGRLSPCSGLGVPLLPWGWQIGANPALLVCRGSEEMLFSEILVLGKQGGGM